MATRSIWKGSISFGVLPIPAKLYTATDDRRVSFHQIPADCGSRIQMPKWCPNCERKLESHEIKRGYEIAQDSHIILEDSDFDSLPLKSLKEIEITEFVDGKAIDIRAYDKCYFLACGDDVAAKAFTLLLRAMESTGLEAIAKLTYREREHLAVISPYDGIMLLHTLHYADELKPYQDLKPRQVELSDRDMDLAQMLVDRMRGDFDHSAYHDAYREALERLIEAKLAGEVITAPAEKAPVGDVADALLQSLEMLGVK